MGVLGPIINTSGFSEFSSKKLLVVAIPWIREPRLMREVSLNSPQRQCDVLKRHLYSVHLEATHNTPQHRENCFNTYK